MGIMMGPQQFTPIPHRKIRTRSHIIADISENHFTHFALRKGFSTESMAHDYGYDILLFTYDESGQIENGHIIVQLKATDHVTLIKKDSYISFTLDKRDLNLWLKEFYPVILVVYDAKREHGYWLYVQQYFETMTSFSPQEAGATINVHIPLKNGVSRAAMAKFAEYKEALNQQIQKIIRTE